MITLGAADTIRGVAGSATSITYTIYGDQVSAGADAFDVLAQGQLPSSIGTLYTVPGSTMALVKGIHLANPTGGAVTASLSVNGTAGSNTILPPVSIVAGGFATYDGRWTFYNDEGQALGVGATGAAGAAGQGVPAGGTAGQRLAKIDGTDYNTEWVSPGGATIDVEEGGSSVVAAATAINFNATDFTITDEGSNVAGVALAAGGGGGGSWSTVGYNTVGGTAETVGIYRQFLQKITLPACLVVSIDVRIKGAAAAQAFGVAGFLYDDSSGEPVHALSINGIGHNSSNPLNLYRVSGVAGDARWFSIPLGVPVAAGDYWYGAGAILQAQVQFFYDATGTGLYWDKGGNTFYTDAPDTTGTVYTIQSHGRTYSFRLNIIEN